MRDPLKKRRIMSEQKSNFKLNHGGVDLADDDRLRPWNSSGIRARPARTDEAPRDFAEASTMFGDPVEVTISDPEHSEVRRLAAEGGWWNHEPRT
jgi:hypothetical protein